MASILKDHKLLNQQMVNSWRAVQATPRNETMLAVVGMESGFETDQIASSSANRTFSATAWCAAQGAASSTTSSRK
jgi:hypothetical protein